MVLLLISMGILSYLFIEIFRKYAIKKELLDHPNHRSSHSFPIPRGGGIVFLILWAIFLATLYLIGYLKIKYLIMFLPPVFLIGLVGFLDDKYQLAARWRFLLQLSAVIYTLTIIGGFPALNVGIGTIHWGWLGYALMAFALLWSINLYNFMDGLDGLAAIEALFVFGFGGYFIWHAGGLGLAYASWGMVFVVLGFLLWNKPPAKIFMGDAGSTLLGFLVALFAILGEKKYNVPALLWMILYGVFWFDATITLIRRLIHGDKVYQPHRLHAFHRLHLYGWSNKKILVGAMVVNMILVGFSFLALYFPRYMLTVLIGSIVMLTIVYIWIEKVKPMYPEIHR